MKKNNKLIRKSTGVFLTVFCLLCSVEKYSMVTAMAEGTENHFVVEEEASFGGTEVQPSNPPQTVQHQTTSPGTPPPQTTPAQTTPDQTTPSQAASSQVPPSQVPTTQSSPSKTTSKDSTFGKSDTDMDMQESISDNNAKFTTPAKADYLWNATRQNGNAIKIAEVSQNGLDENPTKEKWDKETITKEDSHEEVAEEETVEEKIAEEIAMKEQPASGPMWILSVIPAILLLLWGFLRIIKRLRIVYGKL